MKRLLSILLMSAIVTIPSTALSSPKLPFLLLSQQNKEETATQEIQISFPDFVVVSLKSGNRTTGSLIDLNDQNLIISFKGYLTGIPLTEIKSIEFKNNVLIPANETVICQQINSQCRQAIIHQNQNQEPIVIENIQITQLSFFQGAKTALLSIPEQSENEENETINNLSNETTNIINFLEIDESGEMITLTLIPTQR